MLSVADLERTVSDVRYFGDLDRVGLRVPASASAVAVASGLSPVRPAVALYGAFLVAGRPQPGRPEVSEADAKQLVDWLDPIHREPVTQVLVIKWAPGVSPVRRIGVLRWKGILRRLPGWVCGRCR